MAVCATIFQELWQFTALFCIIAQIHLTQVYSGIFPANALRARATTPCQGKIFPNPVSKKNSRPGISARTGIYFCFDYNREHYGRATGEATAVPLIFILSYVTSRKRPV
jgi:hypothetical protein